MERRNQERSRKVSSDNTSVVYCDKLGSLIYSSFILNLVVFEHTYTVSLKVNLFVSLSHTAETSDLPGTEEEEEEEEEGSQGKLSQEEGETSLQRVKGLRVLPMEHNLVVAEPGSDQPDYNPSSQDIDCILGNLEVHDPVQ